jgi:hypothetical protein
MTTVQQPSTIRVTPKAGKREEPWEFEFTQTGEFSGVVVVSFDWHGTERLHSTWGSYREQRRLEWALYGDVDNNDPENVEPGNRSRSAKVWLRPVDGPLTRGWCEPSFPENRLAFIAGTLAGHIRSNDEDLYVEVVY